MNFIAKLEFMKMSPPQEKAIYIYLHRNVERETHTHKGWYFKYRNNDWKRERAGRHDG